MNHIEDLKKRLQAAIREELSTTNVETISEELDDISLDISELVLDVLEKALDDYEEEDHNPV